MKSLDEYLFVRFEGKVLSDPLHKDDTYLKPTREVIATIIERSRFMKPICLVVNRRTFWALTRTLTFSVCRSEVGTFLRSTYLPFDDTRVVCEDFLVDPSPDPQVQRSLDEAFESVYAR